jgi:hypothetical protein
VDRAAERSANGVVAISRFFATGRVLEEVVRVQLLVAEVVVARSAELLGPALRHDIDDAGRSLAVLGLVVVEKHLHFGDRVHRDRRVEARAAPHVAGDAVDIRAAVDASYARDRLRRVLLADPVAAAAVVDDPWQRLQQAEHVASACRQLGDLVVVDQRAALGACRLDRRDLGADDDGLVPRAELEHKIANRQAFG